jgi:hypothetical protein
MLEGKPGSKLRNLCIHALASMGWAGPPYNLDDISAYCELEKNWISIYFWDMVDAIGEKNDCYNGLKWEIERLNFLNS